MENFDIFFKNIFRPEKMKFFRSDFLKSSSRQLGETVGTDSRAIPAV